MDDRPAALPASSSSSGEEIAAGPNLEEHVVGPQSEGIQDAPVGGQSGGGRAGEQLAHTVDSQNGRRLRRSLVMAIDHPVPVIRRSRSNMAEMARHPTTSRISSAAPRASASASVVGKPLNARYDDTAIEGRLASRLNC